MQPKMVTNRWMNEFAALITRRVKDVVPQTPHNYATDNKMNDERMNEKWFAALITRRVKDVVPQTPHNHATGHSFYFTHNYATHDLVRGARAERYVLQEMPLR